MPRAWQGDGFFCLMHGKNEAYSGAVDLTFAPLEPCFGPSLSLEESFITDPWACACQSGGVFPVCPGFHGTNGAWSR